MAISFEKCLRFTSLGALFAALLVPLYVSGELFFPFISGKNFAFRILIEIAFAAWLVLAFRNQDYRPRRSWLLWSALCFIAVLALSAFTAEDSYKSFWSNFERMEGFIGIAHFALAFLVAGSIFRAADWRRFVLGSLGVNVFILGYALLQFSGILSINQGGVRVDATLGNAIYLGVYALFHIFFSILAAYHARKESRSAWLIGCFVALAFGNVVLVFLSATRSIVLGLFAAFIVSSLFLAFSRAASRRTRMAGAIGLVLAALAVGGFFAAREISIFRNNPVFGRILSISFANDDAAARFTIWNIALKGFAERPLFGWGQEGFSFPFSKHYDPSLYGREQWFDRAHNTYLDWLVAAGIFGFLAYLALWISAGRAVFRRDRFSTAERALFAGFGAAYAVNSIFVFDNGVSYFLLCMLLAYIHFRETEGAAPLFSTTSILQNGALARAFAPAVLIILLVSLYWFNARPAYAGALLLNALHPHPDGPLENLAIFRRALALNSFATAEIREQLAQVTTAVAVIPAVPVAVKQEFLALATSELDKEIKKRPADARYYTFMGALLDAFHLYEQGFPYWKEGLARSPKKQMLLFQIGTNRFNAGKLEDATAYFRDAYVLNPNNHEAVIVYASALIYAGDQETEQKVLATPSYAQNSSDDLRLVTAYETVGRISDAITLIRRRLEREPNNKTFQQKLEQLEKLKK